jgi:hypothetical protein
MKRAHFPSITAREVAAVLLTWNQTTYCDDDP